MGRHIGRLVHGKEGVILQEDRKRRRRFRRKDGDRLFPRNRPRRGDLLRGRLDAQGKLVPARRLARTVTRAPFKRIPSLSFFSLVTWAVEK